MFTSIRTYLQQRRQISHPFHIVVIGEPNGARSTMAIFIGPSSSCFRISGVVLHGQHSRPRQTEERDTHSR